MTATIFGTIIFCAIFALAFAGAVVWIMERKARVSRWTIAPFSHSFLAGCVAFSFIYILNRLVFPRWPKTTAVFNLIMLGGILTFRPLRKKLLRQYRRWRRKTEKKHPRSAEAEALKHMLERDPLNAFCLEKLSEIYGEMGENDKALEAAREAFKLDPSVKNKLWVEDLEKEIHAKKRRKNGWNF